MEDRDYLGIESNPAVPPTSDEKNLALMAHVLTIFAPILAPLIIYLLKKNESSFIEAHAKESLNFQITVVIICLLLVISLIGILLVWLVAIIAVILVIVATIRASEGKLYRYPFSIRLIK